MTLTKQRKARCPCPLYCKYCGARRRRDATGHYCPTRNCQWSTGYYCCTMHTKGAGTATEADAVWTSADFAMMREGINRHLNKRGFWG